MNKPPAPTPITPERLEKAALSYLERYAASAESLRRVLLRRLGRVERADDLSEGRDMIEALIARYLRSGLLDDARYAEAKAQSLLRAGRPLGVIARQLAAKGVAGDVVRQVLSSLAESVAEDGGEADLEAARAFVRRRRLGPWRDDAERGAMRRKDLASLARAGFSWRVARMALDEEG